VYDFDLVVIGSGPGGQKAAIAAAKLGKRVCLVERRNMVGWRALRGRDVPLPELARGAIVGDSYGMLKLLVSGGAVASVVRVRTDGRSHGRPPRAGTQSSQAVLSPGRFHSERAVVENPPEHRAKEGYVSHAPDRYDEVFLLEDAAIDHEPLVGNDNDFIPPLQCFPGEPQYSPDCDEPEHYL
jgi:hypothetical protein